MDRQVKRLLAAQAVATKQRTMVRVDDAEDERIREAVKMVCAVASFGIAFALIGAAWLVCAI